MQIIPIEKASVEPVLLEEAKEHLRIDSNDEDTGLAAQIVSARSILEKVTGLTLISRPFDILIDDWRELQNSKLCNNHIKALDYTSIPYGTAGADGLLLPLRPLTAVNSIHIVDDEDVEVLWRSDYYHLSGGLEPILYPINDATWPHAGRGYDAIRMSVTAGFGPSWNDIPEDIHQALLMLLTYLAYHRGDESTSVNNIIHAAGLKALLAPYRRVRV